MNASFAREMPIRGNIAFLTQSGAMACAVLDYAKGAGIAFSKFISFGNKADVSEIDLLAALGEEHLREMGEAGRRRVAHIGRDSVLDRLTATLA